MKPNEYLEAEAIEKLKLLKTDKYPEEEHREADIVLCDLLTDLGYKKVVEYYFNTSL